jgi:hypothetical protein
VVLLTALYRIPLTVEVLFEGEGRPDLDLRVAQTRTAMRRISGYVLREWGLSVEYRLGKPTLVARRNPVDFTVDDEPMEVPAWRSTATARSVSASGRSRSKRSG